MTQPPFLPGPTVNDGLPPSFDEYRWSQLVEENKRIIDVLTALKGRLDTRDTHVDEVEQRLGALEVRLDRLINEVVPLIDRVATLDSVTHTLDSSLASLYSRVAALEDKDQPPAKPVDEINTKIVEFLESTPDVKFTAITIRENLGIPAKYIHDRCKTLVRQGLIRTHVAEGRHPFYQALEKKAEPAVDSPA